MKPRIGGTIPTRSGRDRLTIVFEIGWKLAVVIVLVALLVAGGLAQRRKKERQSWPDRENL